MTAIQGIRSRRRVIVRFAGDSGDGMQLAGSRFTEATAEHGNDFATLPSFPAEIRAPAGTLAGVSAFQILIHALRRNVPLKILMFNNQVYGLTKGQASPTSERGMVTKSTPFGLQDSPFNPLALALGAGATFAARTIDRDRHHMTDVLRAAAGHRGAAFVEIYQNCPVFNDGAFATLTDKDAAVFNRIPIVDGEPIRFGPDGEHGVARNAAGDLEIVAGDRTDLVVHDAHRDDPTLAFALARLAASPTDPRPIGVFRAVDRRVGIAAATPKLAQARANLAPDALGELLHGGDTWTAA